MDWISFLSGFSGTAIAGIGLILTVKDRPVPAIEIGLLPKSGKRYGDGPMMLKRGITIANQGLHPILDVSITPMCEHLSIDPSERHPRVLQTTDEPYRIECTWPQQHEGPLPLRVGYTVAGQHPRRRNLLLLDVGNWRDAPMWFSPGPRWWALDRIRRSRTLLLQRQVAARPIRLADPSRLQHVKRTIRITSRSSTDTDQE